ncbi:hypothetical protein [Vibrio sp. SCSIO 43136]|uniref:hypothetical protein n=1 Tax=Vibrio sp. SCSIO 43136 TaxID=2819101 RepID=UPI0020759460|nr:hypothetical protein [Vibrio sp. SCSIO 43136]USD68145.1 hypothetical protein J4N39_18395 [Vibrio sp. SCSIO 43136]
MSKIQVTGPLEDPTNSASPNTQLRITTTQGYGPTLTGAFSIQKTDTNGNYDFPLNWAVHLLEARYGAAWIVLGKVVVNKDTPSPITISQLLKYTTPLTPPEIELIKRLTEEARLHKVAAGQSAAEASDYKDKAKASEQLAFKYRNEAEGFKNEAKKITGLDKVEEAVDKALDDRHLYMMTEAQGNAISKAIEEQYAASGQVHMGKHGAESSNQHVINEGMWTRPNDPLAANKLFLGKWGLGSAGESKTDYPVLYMAGFERKFVFNQSTAFNTSVAEFPEAEQGTRSFNKDTGVSIDYFKEVDPKYGDKAQTVNEAVCRNFEGPALKNGDYRLGTLHWTLQGTPTFTVANGVATVATTTLGDGIIPSTKLDVGKSNTIEIVVNEISAGGGVNFKYQLASGTRSIALTKGYNKITVADVGQTGDCSIVSGAATTTFKLDSVSIRPTASEVVVDRHDLLGVEGFHEVDNLECFADGNIHDTALTFGDTGIPTVESSRPVSYFAMYDGHRAAKGRCVKIADLTLEQRVKVFRYQGALTYLNEAGSITHVRKRICTYAGIGNFDWECVESTDSKTQILRHSNYGRVWAQGSSDEKPSLGGYSSLNYLSNENAAVTEKQTGLFTVNNGSTIAYKGKCHFLVLTTVKRRNQGAYHERFNKNGCAGFASVSSPTHQVHWYIKSGGSAVGKEPTSAKDCFIGYNSGGSKTERVGSGSVAVGWSAYADGRFYDAIYADGDVVDYRLSASDISPYIGEIRERIKSAKYRGKEQVVCSFPSAITNKTATSYLSFGETRPHFLSDIGTGKNVSWKVHIVRGSALHKTLPVYQAGYSSGVGWNVRTGLGVPEEHGALSTDLIILERTIDSSVSGAFSAKMVIGNPANLLKIDELKFGWEGTWCRVIPDAATRTPFSRKSLVNISKNVYTDDNGATWKTQDWAINTNTNDGGSVSANRVIIANYTAYAKQTEPMMNAVVYNGSKGLGNVWSSADLFPTQGCLLIESLIGKVAKDSQDGNQRKEFCLLETGMDTTNRKLYNAHAPKHSQISLKAPLNNSPAVKAMLYDNVTNQQFIPMFAFNELVWGSVTAVEADGTKGETYEKGKTYNVMNGSVLVAHVVCVNGTTTGFNANMVRQGDNWYHKDSGTLNFVSVRGGSGNWGDDSTIRIIDNVSTFTNLNGDTCLYGTHKLAIPCGWVKQVAKAGSSSTSDLAVPDVVQSYYQPVIYNS